MKIEFKDGKTPKVEKTNILKHNKYTPKEGITLPAFPFGYINLVKNPWGMMANGPDNSISPGFLGVGDCECASEYHKRMVIAAMGGNPKVFTSQDALTLYEKACGYNPDDPNSDQGCEIQAVLEYLKQQGIIDSYLELDNNNITEVYEAIYLFGGASLGIQMPQIFMDAVNNAQEGQEIVWDTAKNDGGILGGHAIPALEAAGSDTTKRNVLVVGVAANGDLIIITYGMVVRMTIAAYNKYCDEGWVSFSKEELNAAGVSPVGFDFATLEADEQAIIGQSPVPVNNLIPTYVLVDPQSGKTGDNINLTAEIYDTQNKAYLPNLTVTFSVGDVTVGNGVSDANGKAKVPYTIRGNLFY